jgi:Spy/CpxP family protein refolding chaperone
MRRCLLCAAALAVVAMTATPAWAQRQRQRGGFGFFRGGSELMLLRQKSVQDELKVTEDQVKKVTELAEKQRGAFGELRNLSREERQKKIEERSKENAKALAEILKPEQVKRLKQISLQQQGARAINNPEVATALNLTAEQKEKVKSIGEEAAKEMRELFQGGNREEARKEMADLRKSTEEKVQGVLTTEQKAKLKELQGEPFKGEIRPPERNRPGGRGARRPSKT